MLARTGVRHKVVVISLPLFRSLHSLASRTPIAGHHCGRCRHPSFGAGDKAKWTYFGDAFFNVASGKLASLKEAFVVAARARPERELREQL